MHDKAFYYWYDKMVLMSEECAEFVILLQGSSDCGTEGEPMLEMDFHDLVSSTQGVSFSVTELVHAANTSAVKRQWIYKV